MKSITSTVLVSIFLKDDQYEILFTERSRSLKHHPGEISFPGGKIETNERPIEAVKRETKEEINADILKIIDSLQPVLTYVSDHNILPFIGIIDTGDLIINPNEVESIHTIPFKIFMKTKMTMKRFPYNNRFISLPVWDFKDFFVWGATGRILMLFKEWAENNHFFNGTSML